MSNLEDKLGVTEVTLSDGKSVISIADPEDRVKGILYKDRKLVDPNRLKEAVDENFKLKKELEFNDDLLNMHRYFDDLRDFLKKGKTEDRKKDIEKCLSGVLSFLGYRLNSLYLGFHLNQELKNEGKIEQEHANYKCIEILLGKTGYTLLNGDGQLFFNNFRLSNPAFEIDNVTHQNFYYEGIETNAKQVDEVKKLGGDGFTLYLKPGHDIIGAIQAIQTKNIGKNDVRFIDEWVKLADTFISDILKIKVEKEKDSAFSESKDIANTFGLSTEELTSSFEGAGDLSDKLKGIKKEQKTEAKKASWMFYEPKSYFDTNFSDIRDGIIGFSSGFKTIYVEGDNLSIEDLGKKRFEKAKRLIGDIYRERPEFEITKEDAEKDTNSAISCMKLIFGLYENYGNDIIKDFKLSDGRDVDKETLQTASMFAAAFARSVKYMHQADKIKSVKEVREKNDIREMTSYLAALIENPKLSGQLRYHGEPLMDMNGNPSLLGSTIIDISEKIDPNKESHFAIDLVEKVMEYEELVQETTKSPGMPVEKALFSMYEGCIIKDADGKMGINKKGIRAINMIDNLVHPKGTNVYNQFAEKYQKKSK